MTSQGEHHMSKLTFVCLFLKRPKACYSEIVDVVSSLPGFCKLLRLHPHMCVHGFQLVLSQLRHPTHVKVITPPGFLSYVAHHSLDGAEPAHAACAIWRVNLLSDRAKSAVLLKCMHSHSLFGYAAKRTRGTPPTLSQESFYFHSCPDI